MGKCQQRLGLQPYQQLSQSNVQIEDVKTGYKVFKLWKNGAPTSEYFLVENRQKILFDKFLPNSGLLIWHIDDAATDNTNEAHFKVALVLQADGKKDLELNTTGGMWVIRIRDLPIIEVSYTSNPNSSHPTRVPRLCLG